MLSDNANGYVIADAMLVQAYTGPRVIDNGQVGYSETGTGWLSFTDPNAYNGNERYVAAGTGANTATWQATGLAAGTYDVEMTWTAYSNRATNATYQVFDGTTLLATVQVNQQVTPTGGLTVNGMPFQSLGHFTINSGTLTVVVSDNANGYVIADAMFAQVYTGPKVIDNGQFGYSETGSWLGLLLGVHRLRRQPALRLGRQRQHGHVAGYRFDGWQLRRGDDLGGLLRSVRQRDLPGVRWHDPSGHGPGQPAVGPDGGTDCKRHNLPEPRHLRYHQRHVESRALGQHPREYANGYFVVADAMLVEKDQLVVTTQPPTGMPVGTPFGLVVTAEEGQGNVDSAFNGSVTVYDPYGYALGGTTTVNAVNGVATFSGLTLNQPSNFATLYVTSTGWATISTNYFTVTPAAASQLGDIDPRWRSGQWSVWLDGLCRGPLRQRRSELQRQRDAGADEQPRQRDAGRDADGAGRWRRGDISRA